MFKKKSPIEPSGAGIRFHPGIYKFQFPYISGNFYSQDKNGLIPTYMCDVELHVGLYNQLENEGILVTAVIKANQELGSVGIENFIEDIATKIRLSFFDHIFHENISVKKMVPDNMIRWLQIHPPQWGFFTDEDCREVKFNWNDQLKKYTHPTWSKFDNWPISNAR